MNDPLARTDDDRGDGTLFAKPREIETPRRRGRRSLADTSRAAYRAHNRQSDRERALRVLIERGPSTIEEIAIAMGKVANQISGRFCQLEDLGLAVRIDERRPTRSSSAQAWRAATVGGR